MVLRYINMNPPWVYTCSQSWTPLPPRSPYHPSGSSQCTSSKHPEIVSPVSIQDLFFLIRGSLFYSVVLVSAIYQCESVIIMTDLASIPICQSHPSRSSQCTSRKHPVSCIEPGLAIRFLYDIIHVSMHSPKSSPTPTESKRLFYTSVSLLLSRIQGYHYHLSKFHIYALVYCMNRTSFLGVSSRRSFGSS